MVHITVHPTHFGQSVHLVLVRKHILRQRVRRAGARKPRLVLHVDICLYVYKRITISMFVMCDASDTTEYGRRTPELSNVALHMKHNNNSIE